MTRTVTLSQLQTDIRFQADLVGATNRHDDTQLTRIINQSINGFRERVTIEGDTFYLTRASATASAGVAATGVAYQTVDISSLSPAPVRTYGVDAVISGEVVTLHHIDFHARNDYGGGTSPGEPTAWAHYQKDTLAIFPQPDQAYTLMVYYLPTVTNLSAAGDTFDGVAGWEEWIVWDCVTRLIMRDQYPGAFQMAEQQRNERWMAIAKTAGRASHAGGNHIGRDTLGARSRGMMRKRHLPAP